MTPIGLRQEFEDAYIRHMGYADLMRKRCFMRSTDDEGRYKSSTLHNMWIGFQLARGVKPKS